MNWNAIGAGAFLLVEVLILVWIAKKVAGLVLRRDLDRDLTTLDNPALAITLSGYLLAVFVSLSHLLTGAPADLVRDLQETAMLGGLAMACLLLSMLGWPLFLRVHLRQDIFEERNIGSGMTAFAGFLATGLIFRGSLSGEGGMITHVAAFFLLGQAALFLTAWIYQWMTPYDIYKEIHERGNIAAALGFSGALVAIGIIAGHAASGDFMSWHESLKDFAEMLVPLLLFWPVRWLVVNGLLLNWRNVDREITRDRNVGAGLVEAVAYIGIALFVTHLL